jgi:hypothetical protein
LYPILGVVGSGLVLFNLLVSTGVINTFGAVHLENVAVHDAPIHVSNNILLAHSSDHVADAC